MDSNLIIRFEVRSVILNALILNVLVLFFECLYRGKRAFWNLWGIWEHLSHSKRFQESVIRWPVKKLAIIYQFVIQGMEQKPRVFLDPLVQLWIIKQMTHECYKCWCFAIVCEKFFHEDLLSVIHLSSDNFCQAEKFAKQMYI